MGLNLMSRSPNTKNRTKSENKSIMENNHTANHGFSMLPFTWVVVFFVLGFYIAQAQDAVKQHSDSLLNNARKAPTTELKIEALLNVSIFWIDYDTAKAHQYLAEARRLMDKPPTDYQKGLYHRSEEHTSELQSRENLVCRLLLEKKK